MFCVVVMECSMWGMGVSRVEERSESQVFLSGGWAKWGGREERSEWR